MDCVRPPTSCGGKPASGGHRSAFSMIEMIVVIALVGTVMAFGVAFWRGSQKSGMKSVAEKFTLQMEVRKAADVLLGEIRKGTNIVKPGVGETAPYLVFRDLLNRMSFLFLENDVLHSKKYNRVLYRLRYYNDDYSGSFNPKNGKILVESISRLSFTPLSPMSIQVAATLANEKQESQFITTVGFMTMGELE